MFVPHWLGGTDVQDLDWRARRVVLAPVSAGSAFSSTAPSAPAAAASSSSPSAPMDLIAGMTVPARCLSEVWGSSDPERYATAVLRPPSRTRFQLFAAPPAQGRHNLTPGSAGIGMYVRRGNLTAELLWGARQATV